MFYRRHGDGADQALILCHGLASNSTRWNELGRNLTLPAGWCLLCPDLRGHGQTPWRGRLDSACWIDDLVDMMDAEGLARAVIGGHCMGANLALRFAALRPERCLGLILIEPMLPQARVGRLRLKSALRWLLPGLAVLVRTGNALGLRRAEIPQLDLEALDRDTRALMDQAGDSRAMTRRYAVPLRDLDHTGTAAYLQALCETLKRLPEPARLDGPALALISSGGLFGDPALTQAALAAMPDCETRLLDAEHWIPTEQPQAMREAIEDWLSTRFA